MVEIKGFGKGASTFSAPLFDITRKLPEKFIPANNIQGPVAWILENQKASNGKKLKTAQITQIGLVDAYSALTIPGILQEAYDSLPINQDIRQKRNSSLPSGLSQKMGALALAEYIQVILPMMRN